MKKVALEFTYYTDIIEIPDNIALNIKKIQRHFDKWLYDKENNHGCWIYIDGKKQAVSFDSQTFVDYINKFILGNDNYKASIIEKQVLTVPSDIPVLFF